MSHILQVENLNKNYGAKIALQELSLSVPASGIYGLLGPNGAGKTTLIRIINQIIKPDNGRILFDGKPLKPEDVASIGYLPEERGLYKNMKVGEQALYLAQLKGSVVPEAKSRLKYWFDRLDIADWWGKKIQELSKGMAKKYNLLLQYYTSLNYLFSMSLLVALILSMLILFR